MEKEKLIRYWIDSSEQDHRAMNHLFENHDFHWSLFMGHLVLEKLLKAYFIKSKQADPPLIHDLVRIAERAGLTLSDEQMDMLDTITTFNIRARYDDYKQLFYQKCTLQFTEEWINKIREIARWIKTKL
jgi:HEPN domain-containing protein